MPAWDAVGCCREPRPWPLPQRQAARRRQALDTYETARSKHVEDFEARKMAENTQIEAELESLRAHYTERIQRNLDLMTKEKESLRNWQMAAQHENQRITQVLELCGHTPAANRTALSGPRAMVEKPMSEPVTVDTSRRASPSLRPSLLSGD